LFLPFAAALAVWIVVSRSYKLLAGSVSAFAISSFAVSLVDPRAWRDYLVMMRSPAVENDFIPCLPAFLRHWLSPRDVWLQALPAAFCCAWAIIYFWRRRTRWDWIANASPLMLASLLFAPYSWLYDQCLAMPALLHGAYATRSRNMLAVLAFLILAADIEICLVKVASPWWLWTTPAWLAWYLLARRSNAQSVTDSSQAQA